MSDNTKLDVYKFRAEDFWNNYTSLREIEWRITWESLTMYALVATGYFQLSNTNSPPAWGGLGAAIAATLVLLFQIYMSFMVQKRLHFARHWQRQYILKLHDESGAEK